MGAGLIMAGSAAAPPEDAGVAGQPGFFGLGIADPARAFLYGRDPFFREAVATAGLWPEFSGEDLASALLASSLLVFKPDAFAAGSIEKGLEFVRDAGLEPLHCESFTFTPALIRSLWYYQFNRATLERLVLTDALHGFAPSLAVLVRRPASGGASASVALAALKGSAEPEGRAAATLRAVLGDHNMVLNKVHTPDDPPSYLRDLWICLGGGAVRRWLAVAAGLAPGHLRLPAATVPGLLGLAEAADALRAGLAGDSALWAALEQSAARRHLSASLLRRLLAAAGGDRELRWAAIVFATYLIPLNRPGVKKLI
jgi:hypothetical protein